MIMSLKQRKIKFKARKKLNYNIYNTIRLLEAQSEKLRELQKTIIAG